MNPRNMQSQQHPESYILLGSPLNFPQSSFHQILPASGSIQSQYPMHLGVPTPSNFYYPHQMPSFNNFGYVMNGFAPEGFSKINGTEGFMGNIQYFNAPVDGGVAIIDACNPMPQYRGNYVGPFFHPPASTWCERQPNGPRRFHEGASTSRGSLDHSPYNPMLHPLNNLHPQNTQEGDQYNVNHHPPIATTSSIHPMNNTTQYASIGHPQQGPQQVAPNHGIRTYRPHRRNLTPEGVHRHHNLHHLRLLQEEGIAILEVSGHHEARSAIDHHRDMLLDTDYMSYEELLALSERIGHVDTGLSEEAINTHLNTKLYVSSVGTIDLDDNKDLCVICQDEYEDNDIIGSLDCGHEYHVDCLKKWLLEKNVCAICKSTALKVEHKSG